MSTLTLKTLVEKVVTEVTAEQVKEATQKDYNQREWNKTVDRYLGYDSNAKFYCTPGRIYSMDYYVVYMTREGIRFLAEVQYGSSLSSGGFAFGWFHTVEEVTTMKVCAYEEGRISGQDETARQYMVAESQFTTFGEKFFTKVF